jgi:hypothetical protein
VPDVEPARPDLPRANLSDEANPHPTFHCTYSHGAEDANGTSPKLAVHYAGAGWGPWFVCTIPPSFQRRIAIVAALGLDQGL